MEKNLYRVKFLVPGKLGMIYCTFVTEGSDFKDAEAEVLSRKGGVKILEIELVKTVEKKPTNEETCVYGPEY